MEEKKKNIFAKRLSATNFAVYFVICAGILMIIISLFLNKLLKTNLIYIYSILWFFSLIFAIFILKGKKWAWYLEQIFLLTLIILAIVPLFVCFGSTDPKLGILGCMMVYSFNILFIVFLPPFIPFLLFYADRKNFFKIIK